MIFSPSGNKIFFVQLISLISLILFFFKGSFNVIDVLIIFFFTFLYAILGIALTFHRILSHRSYKVNDILNKILVIIGIHANVGSPITWVAIHRAHHLHCDTFLDPHSPNHKNIFFVLFFSMYSKVNLKYSRDLLRNKFFIFTHRNYYLLQLPWILLLYLLGGFEAILIAHIIPGSLTWILGSFLNFLNHKIGYRNFNTNDKSKNNILTALMLFGEGWHNNHHAHPNRSSLQVLPYEIDLIDIIARKILLLK